MRLARAGGGILTDLAHFTIGFLSCYLPFLIPIFFIYQVFERERGVEKVCDYLEFLLGFLFGLGVRNL